MLARIRSWYGAEELTLPTNYRCGVRIVELAKGLIEASSLREKLPLLGAPRVCGQGETRLAACGTRSAEVHAIADELALLQHARQLSEKGVAVLCRTNAEVAEIKRALKDAGVMLKRGTEEWERGGGGMRSEMLAAAREALAYLRLCISPHDDAAFEAALRVPPRTGFVSANAASAAAGPPPGLNYLQVLLQHLGRHPAPPSGRQAQPTSLLGAAQAAAARSFPALPSAGAGSGSGGCGGAFGAGSSCAGGGSGSGGGGHSGGGGGGGSGAAASVSLTRPQQQALRSFLSALEVTSKDASRLPPSALLEALASRLGLAEHAHKAAKHKAQARKSFHVHMPGEPRKPDRDAVSSGDEDEDEDEDDEECGGAGAGGGGAAAAESKGAATVRQLVRISRAVEERLRREEPTAHPPLRFLGRWLDEMAIATHDELGGSILAEPMPSASPSTAATAAAAGAASTAAHAATSRAAGGTVGAQHGVATSGAAGGTVGAQHGVGVSVTTLHQSKGLEWDTVYLPGLVDGSLPLLSRGLLPNSLELIEHLEEERRLLYVGMTRARRVLVLSWAREGGAKSGDALAPSTEPTLNKPSRFLPPDPSAAAQSSKRARDDARDDDGLGTEPW
jgi:hypothetical protein